MIDSVTAAMAVGPSKRALILMLFGTAVGPFWLQNAAHTG